jgi:hypothetical protein
MRLREFIVEARVMDPKFSILPLGGNGGGERSSNQKNGQTQKKE